MNFITLKKSVFLVAFLCITSFELQAELSPEARAKGFVYLHEVDPTIQVSLRYLTSENFVGKSVDGYKKPVVVMTKQAALALKKVQEEVEKDGYSLVVYDAYRPQQAVDHFVRWGKDTKNQSKKAEYYPRINKAQVFELGYVAAKSGHSRGSTVDLTLIKKTQQLHDLSVKERTLEDGFVIKILDDGTVDMGSSFDLFDVASHTENDLIADEYKPLRAYLKEVMARHGFKNLADEWWHYTLLNEPYPADQESSYFNFPIE